MAIAYGFSVNQCLVQYLHLRSVTISNEEVDILADSFEDYLYLLHLDLSQNRIEGTRGGAAITRILARKPHLKGGQEILHLNISNNKLGSGGLATIVQYLITDDSHEDLTLNVGYNGIEEIRLLTAIDSSSDKIFNVKNLILDGNLFR